MSRQNTLALILPISMFLFTCTLAQQCLPTAATSCPSPPASVSPIPPPPPPPPYILLEFYSTPTCLGSRSATKPGSDSDSSDGGGGNTTAISSHYLIPATCVASTALPLLFSPSNRPSNTTTKSSPPATAAGISPTGHPTSAAAVAFTASFMGEAYLLPELTLRTDESCGSAAGVDGDEQGTVEVAFERFDEISGGRGGVMMGRRTRCLAWSVPDRAGSMEGKSKRVGSVGFRVRRVPDRRGRVRGRSWA